MIVSAVIAVAVGGCRRDSAAPDGSNPVAASAAVPSVPVPPAVPPAPAAAVGDRVKTLGDVDVRDLPLAGKRLTVMVPSVGETALLIEPAMGEWSSLMVIRDEDSVTVSDVPGVLTLTYAMGKSEGSLTLGGAAAMRVPMKPHAHETGRPPAPVVPTLTGDADQPRVLGRHGAVLVTWRNEFLPAFPSLPVPKPLHLGAAVVTPEAVTARRVEGCVVRGTRPAASGALDDALRGAFESETKSVCQAHGGRAILEASYSLVRFAGVNKRETGREPGPTDVVAMTLAQRVTNDKGSVIVETGYLLGLAKPEVVALRSLLSPTGATWLSREARALAEVPKGLDASLVVDARGGALSVGISTVDFLVDTLPYGLFLRSRRLGIGPRSVTAAAFVNGPLTQRMLAAVNVDY